MDTYHFHSDALGKSSRTRSGDCRRVGSGHTLQRKKENRPDDFPLRTGSLERFRGNLRRVQFRRMNPGLISRTARSCVTRALSASSYGTTRNCRRSLVVCMHLFELCPQIMCRKERAFAQLRAVREMHPRFIEARSHNTVCSEIKAHAGIITQGNESCNNYSSTKISENSVRANCVVCSKFKL
jgi:hypothetical protein